MKMINKYILFLLLFVSEIALAIIHFYYGISSLLNMLYDTLRLKLYFAIFWDYNQQSYKYEDYMSRAIIYHTNPVYCILISIALSLLLALIIKYNKEKNTIFRALTCISIFILVVSLIITVGVLYCYCDEMSHEVV